MIGAKGEMATLPTDIPLRLKERRMVADSKPPRDSDPDSSMSTGTWAVITTGLVVCFLLIPGYITLVSQGTLVSSFGLTWFDTFFALPVIPAVILGMIGIWTALADIEMEEENVREEITDNETGFGSFTDVLRSHDKKFR